MIKGIFKVQFRDDIVEVGPNYETTMVDLVMGFAAECDMSKDYDSLLKLVLADYPEVKVNREDDLDTFFFMMFDEGFHYSFDEALGYYKYLLVSNPALLGVETNRKIARFFYDASLHCAAAFKEKYRPQFEQALSANLYAPNMAFIQGCELVGFPLDEWLELWPEQFFDVGIELKGNSVGGIVKVL